MGLRDRVFIDRVAEGLWQTITGTDDRGLDAYRAWLALPGSEKLKWRTRACKQRHRRLDAIQRANKLKLRDYQPIPVETWDGPPV